jgi:hypothetical protein
VSPKAYDAQKKETRGPSVGEVSANEPSSTGSG